MDVVLGLDPSYRSWCVPVSTVPRWSAAEPSLEVVRLAKLAPDISGNDFADVSSRVGFGYWRHLQPTRSRGVAKYLGPDSETLVCSHVHLSSFPVCATATYERSRAPAAQVVHLRCHAIDRRHHPPIHHLCSYRLTVARA